MRARLWMLTLTVAFLITVVSVSHILGEAGEHHEGTTDLDDPEEDPKAEKLIAEAYALDKPGTKKKALNLLEQIVQMYPNSHRLPEIYFRMATISNQIGKPGAIEYLHKIINE